MSDGMRDVVKPRLVVDASVRRLLQRASCETRSVTLLLVGLVVRCGSSSQLRVRLVDGRLVPRCSRRWRRQSSRARDSRGRRIASRSRGVRGNRSC